MIALHIYMHYIKVCAKWQGKSAVETILGDNEGIPKQCALVRTGLQWGIQPRNKSIDEQTTFGDT